MIRTLLALVLATVTALALAQDSAPPSVKVVFPKVLKAGAKVKATIEVTFAVGLHGYQNPPSDDYQIPVKVTLDTKGFTPAKPQYPKGTLKTMPGESKPTAIYEGTVKIPVVLTLPKKPGHSEVQFTVSYQQCNDQTCFPPDKVVTKVKLTITK